MRLDSADDAFITGVSNGGNTAGLSWSGAPSWFVVHGVRGTLPLDGGVRNGALGVNDAGDVVGFISFPIEPFGAEHAISLSTNSGQLTDLATLGGSSSIAFAVNERGQITGWANLPGSPFREPQHAFLYDRGQMVDLGTLGGSNSFGLAIDSAGRVAGFSDVDFSSRFPPRRAFLHDRNGMHDLGTLPGRTSSEAQSRAAPSRSCQTTKADRLDGWPSGIGALLVPVRVAVQDRRRPAVARSAAAAVEVLHGQRRRVQLVEATRVDRHHRSARALPASERAHAAHFAKQMVDVLLAELVVGQEVLTLLELERVGRHERQQRAGAPADRAIALHDRLREIDLDSISHDAAVASALAGFGHLESPPARSSRSCNLRRLSRRATSRGCRAGARVTAWSEIDGSDPRLPTFV
jgi:probable HAF family extracellular repeat protein